LAKAEKGRACGEPEIGEGGTNTIERSRDVPAPLSRSRAAALEEEIAVGFEEGVEETEEESAGDGDDEEELEAVFPGPETGALHEELALAEAEGHLDPPAAGVGENHLPQGGGSVGELVGGPSQLRPGTTTRGPEGGL
jgi:hypothetical protein